MVISWRKYYDLNITFSDAKPITNLNDAFISYTLQCLCDLDANFNKKHCFIGLMPARMPSLQVIPRGNLLNSCML